MPTGYTAQLMDKGQDFRTFALQCARAMGACVMQRDDPMDEPPKEQPESGYYAKRLAETTAEIDRLSAMSAKEISDYGFAARAKEIANATEYLDRGRAENVRLDDMLAKVNAWTAPTTEHAGFKAFMVEQLTISRNNLSYSEKRLYDAKNKSAQQYYADALMEAMRTLECMREEAAKDTKRTADRNEWIRQLYASLG